LLDCGDRIAITTQVKQEPRMAKVQPKTLAEVRAKLDDKIMEAFDFLCDMETWKKDQTRFTHRVSAFLSASESVLLMIHKHATRYARDHGREYKFAAWYEAKADAFRMPNAARKAEKLIGSDAEWVYLRAARDDTIHIERTDLAHLTRVATTIRLHVSDGIRVIEHHQDGTSEVVVDAPSKTLTPEPDETKEEMGLWAFKPIEIVDQAGNITDVINPPMEDVVSVCKRHLDKLIELVEECEQELSTY
jgi:hypothetical protein